MKKIFYTFIVVFAMVSFLTGCMSSKGVTYVPNIDSISLAPSKGQFDAKIMPKDFLNISVNTIDQDAAKPFNLYTEGSGQGAEGYQVDNDGFINFPVLGRIHVAGLTKNECEDLIKSKIQPYLARTENPIVTVKMSGFHITVTGEVTSPKVVAVSNGKMNIFEAITEAGDLTIYGKRDNILLIREDASGEKHSVRLNLNDGNIINSPYYYLQQNDVIYVEPNKTKARNANTANTQWLTYSGLAISLISLIYAITK